MTCGGDIAVSVAVTTGDARMGRVSIGQTADRSNDRIVSVTQFRSYSRGTDRTGHGGSTGCLQPVMTGSGNEIVFVAMATGGAGIRGVSILHTFNRRYNTCVTMPRSITIGNSTNGAGSCAGTGGGTPAVTRRYNGAVYITVAAGAAGVGCVAVLRTGCSGDFLRVTVTKGISGGCAASAAGLGAGAGCYGITVTQFGTLGFTAAGTGLWCGTGCVGPGMPQ